MIIRENVLLILHKTVLFDASCEASCRDSSDEGL